MRKILVVSGKSPSKEAAIEILKGGDVSCCHRDYQLEPMIVQNRPDLILTDGTCKTRIPEDDKPVPIFFNPKKVAKKHGVPVKSLEWFLFTEKIKALFTRKTKVA